MLLEKIILPEKNQNMDVFFLIDASNSMISRKEMINEMMDALIPSMRKISKGYDNINFRIAVMSFSSETEWRTDGLVDISKFDWNCFEFGGYCEFKKVFKELGSRFLRKYFITELSEFYPVIILISNGHTNDGWEKELEKLEKNKYFQKAIKVSIALGKGVFKDVLQRFATMDTVLIPYNISMFKRIIKYALIPRILNVECCGGEDGGFQFAPWMVWNDHFFQEDYNYCHEYLGWYLWNGYYYQERENVISDDIEIYRKKSDDSESWWEEQKYNPILDECISYRINIEKKIENDDFLATRDISPTIEQINNKNTNINDDDGW